MCSALTSVAAASRAFAGYFQQIAVVSFVVLVPLFILGLAAINFRGVSESVKVNVVMTCVELRGSDRDRRRLLGTGLRPR
jgi:hypothetical protein